MVIRDNGLYWFDTIDGDTSRMDPKYIYQQLKLFMFPYDFNARNSCIKITRESNKYFLKQANHKRWAWLDRVLPSSG
jgi:hypothetical protein